MTVNFDPRRPALRAFKPVGFVLLLLSTSTLLTNAYYLRFAEPALSRTVLAVGLFAVTGAWFLIGYCGLPANREELTGLFVRARTPLLLLVILVLAFAVRYDGIESGLPQSYIPDEYECVQEIQVEDVLFWGRFGAGVIPGTLGVLLVFFLARWVFGTRVGLVAAAVLAVAPGVVEISQYNKPDALLVLFSIVSVLVTLVYLERGGRALAFAAGAAVGLTVAVKYNSALLLVPFVVAMLFRRGTSILSKSDLYLGAVGTVVGFTAGCPYFYADLSRFLDHVAAGLYNYGFGGLPGAEGINNWRTHASYTVRYGMGLLPFLFGLFGLTLALYRIDRRMVVFLAYPVLYYSFYSSQRINFAGNLMPVYPFLAILAAYGVVEVIAFIRTRVAKRLERPIAFGARSFEIAGLVAVVVLLLWFPMSMTLRRNRMITLPDTGTMAARWIEASLPEGTSFAIERHAPVLDLKRFRVSQTKRAIDVGVAHHREAGAEYIIVTSTSYKRYGPENRQTKNYEKLFNLCPLVKEFAPEPRRLFGPTIRILQVPAAEAG